MRTPIAAAWVAGVLVTGCGDNFQVQEEYPFPVEIDRFSGLVALADAGGLPLHPAHAHLLRDGGVLLIGKNGNAGILTAAQLAATPDAVQLGAAIPDVEIPAPSPPYLVADSLFCAGHTQLADGAFFSVGGSRYHVHSVELDHGQPGPDFLTGLAYGTVLDGTWRRTTARMTVSGPANNTRWYPQATRLVDGRILIVGGWDLPVFTPPGVGPQEGTRNVSAEIYDPGTGPDTGTFTPLTTLATTPAAIFNRDYTHVFVLPTGEDDGLAFGESSAPVMFAIDRPEVWSTRLVPRPGNVLGPGGVSVTAPNDRASSAMLPIRLQDGEWGYHNGAVLVAGGVGMANERSIDVYDPFTNAWCVSAAETGGCDLRRLDMIGRRGHPSTVVLPDGQILVIGGHHKPSSVTLRKALLVDPAHGFQITQGQAALDEVRGYHGVALLLPDGRVLVGGGRTAGPDDPEDERDDLRFYSPPYLAPDRRSLRPTITSAPAILRYDTGAAIGATGELTEAVLVGLGSMTHSFDSNQRYVQLALTPAPGGATIIGPRDARAAPPGYYMLFVLGPQRTPSVAQIVRVCAGC